MKSLVDCTARSQPRLCDARYTVHLCQRLDRDSLLSFISASNYNDISEYERTLFSSNNSFIVSTGTCAEEPVEIFQNSSVERTSNNTWEKKTSVFNLISQCLI